MNLALVTATDTKLAQQTIDYLKRNSYSIKTINDHENINSSILERVTSVIFFPEQVNRQLKDLLEQTLQPEETLLFDFQNPTPEIKNIWSAVNDVVMGGVSQSGLKILSDQAIFTGVVSIANNGGFASIRTQNFIPPWDLSPYEGIRLKVRGDGNRYKFITRCEGKWDGISYCFSFDTVADSLTTIEINFKELIPVFRAKTVPESGSFDPSQVYSMQLMLSKFEYDGGYNPHFRAGNFALEIDSIKAYGGKYLPKIVLMGDASKWQNVTFDNSFLKIYAQIPEDLSI